MRPDKKKKRDFKGAAGREADTAPAAAPAQEVAPQPGVSTENKHETDQSKSESDAERTRYARRNISSNWTKYEIPTSDDDDENAEDIALTGEDFRSALQRAGKGLLL
jgi:hypothetical protein